MQENTLGWTFADGNATSLAESLSNIARNLTKRQHELQTRLSHYAQNCDYAAFSRAIAALW